MTKYGKFDSDQAALDQRATIQSERAERDLEQWFLDCVRPEPHWKVLELGCGLGKQTFILAPRVKEIVAVDISQEAVDTVNYYARDGGLNVRAYQASFDDQHWHMNGQYDLIFSIYAIYYATNMMEILRRMRFHLNEKGKVFVAVPGAGSNDEMKDLEERASGVTLPRVKSFITQDQVAALVTEYSSVEEHWLPNRIVFQNSWEVMKWWRNHNSYNPDHDGDVEVALRRHFIQHETFAVTKNVLGISLYR
jgi:SAM-dependent methyltransferase